MVKTEDEPSASGPASRLVMASAVAVTGSGDAGSLEDDNTDEAVVGADVTEDVAVWIDVAAAADVAEVEVEAGMSPDSSRIVAAGTAGTV